jgi:hypothetical protein
LSSNHPVITNNNTLYIGSRLSSAQDGHNRLSSGSCRTRSFSLNVPSWGEIISVQWFQFHHAILRRVLQHNKAERRQGSYSKGGLSEPFKNFRVTLLLLFCLPGRARYVVSSAGFCVKSINNTPTVLCLLLLVNDSPLVPVSTTSR